MKIAINCFEVNSGGQTECAQRRGCLSSVGAIPTRHLARSSRQLTKRRLRENETVVAFKTDESHADSASRQPIMRVNVEQPSKRPTRPPTFYVHRQNPGQDPHNQSAKTIISRYTIGVRPNVRRVEGIGLQWVQFPPGIWVAPAGSYRSDVRRKRNRRSLRDRRVAWRLGEPTGRNASER